ncbi:Fe(3+)-hydroxamate ABC transporter permease FhuB [Poseidonocella sp. HB161398]|uniref:Fe(3+)-hydroxamate ABC transporter permease FhuB n=1 Tax=Poseidonocella sp. HB161398 TaxID=2320855 RepID=UPI001109308B|nr:Fe(3+)-hydroxamate ABC transporter permease FhuB [Poseidonocella sp. HB161398]
MTLRAILPLAAAGLLAAALWSLAALRLMPLPWPLPPFDPSGMSLDGILLAFGLMPRGAVALLAGALLGLSGQILQTVFRNPVADPSVLGISSGAQLALVAATLFAPELLGWGRWPVALAGAAAAAGLVMGLGALRGFHPVTMVIAGMLAGLFASAIASALVLSQGQYLFSLVVWNGGSLVQTGWQPALSLAGVLAAGGLCAALLARPLGLMQLGAAAGSLGMNAALVRLGGAALAVALAAAVSAAVGLVGFVGLAAPALARGLGARRIGQRLLLAPLCGALLLWLCDGLVLALAGAGGEMFPAGAVTGLIGAPLLLWMLPRLRAAAPPEAAPHLPRAARPERLLALLLAAALAAVVLLAMAGRVPGGWDILRGETLRQFLPNRLPRLLGAGAAGGLLGLAGAVLQRLTGNPLASPEVLGVSGGAAMGYAATLFAMAAPPAAALALGAGGGGALALLLLAVAALRGGIGPERVLLGGIAVSALAGAVLSALMAAGTAKSFAVLAWLSGSAASLSATGALGLLALLLLLLAACAAARRWLELLPLGPATARALGLPVERAWAAMILVAGLATGAATVLVGPLSFAGLMAPHLARRLGLARPLHQIAGAVLIGALLMLAADFGARMAAFPYDLPLGLFASLLGTPWLLWLLMRRQG